MAGWHFFLAGLVLSTSAQAREATQPTSFEFAKTQVGDFDLVAETQIEWSPTLPFIGDVTCEGENDDMRFWVNSRGVVQLTLDFLGPPDESGNRLRTFGGDGVWLWVDGERYEYFFIPDPDGRFFNFPYPVPTEDSGPIVLQLQGHRAVSRDGRDPPLSFSMLTNDIVRARQIQWGFKSLEPRWRDREAPQKWQTQRFTINNAGLSEAVDWCASQVASDKARQLPQALISEFSDLGN